MGLVQLQLMLHELFNDLNVLEMPLLLCVKVPICLALHGLAKSLVLVGRDEILLQFENWRSLSIIVERTHDRPETVIHQSTLLPLL